ncbi:Ig-like domain-containing protein [Peribacillus asahii]|uniref:Ig-like domain-containing protein n=1 Tax=Peribacillus asahii TaxID=228899 RepID=UPI00207A994B|nr:Ig-like domain-containing protein [Peribacillus asahii]USK71815.1 Ig-like domain-containing protein [Peribacillus asahii]
MKRYLLKAGVLTCLTLGLFYEEASAESTLASKCEAYGEIQPNQNPSFQHVNCLLTNAALEANIPPEVVKAVTTQENGGWKQFDGNGKPIISDDDGIGLMQITNQPQYDQQKLQNDISYNIEAGIEILNGMYKRTDLPKIKGADKQVIENWYFPIMAYNGTKPANSPLVQRTGAKNKNAYQEKVFYHIEEDSFSGDTTLGKFPFKTADFEYDPTSNKNIVFKKKEYSLTDEIHPSAYFFKKGDKVVVTEKIANLRSKPSTSANGDALTENTTLIINGTFKYDLSATSQNQFVWYPVQTADQKLAGYISSAYITKKIDKPSVDTIDDNDTYLSGKAEANAIVEIKRNNKKFKSTKANANGNFKVKIGVQKAGTSLTVTFKNEFNATSPEKTVTVVDKTPPTTPSISTIKKTTKTVTGKTEAYATIQLKVKQKVIGSRKADKSGKYTIKITPQKSGTTVTATATDKAGNKSKPATRTVQ